MTINPITVAPVPPGALLGRIRAWEAVAGGEVARWGPEVAAVSVLLGLVFWVLGAVLGWPGLKRTGVMCVLTGPIGVAASLVVLNALQRIG